MSNTEQKGAVPSPFLSALEYARETKVDAGMKDGFVPPDGSMPDGWSVTFIPGKDKLRLVRTVQEELPGHTFANLEEAAAFARGYESAKAGE